MEDRRGWSSSANHRVTHNHRNLRRSRRGRRGLRGRRGRCHYDLIHLLTHRRSRHREAEKCEGLGSELMQRLVDGCEDHVECIRLSNRGRPSNHRGRERGARTRRTRSLRADRGDTRLRGRRPNRRSHASGYTRGHNGRENGS